MRNPKLFSMESPIAIGDTTTNSINQRLITTHLETSFIPSIYAVEYSGEKCIQLSINFPHDNSSKFILRRVQDSYVNITQLLSILILLNHCTDDQIQRFISDNILSNLQYFSPDGYTAEFNDLTNDKNANLKGIWISFDKAVSVANKFDIYELTKKLFLVDVHDFDELPKLDVKSSEPGVKTEDIGDLGSPVSRKRKLEDEEPISFKRFKSLLQTNSNYPYTLPPLSLKDKDPEVVNEVKMKFSEIFKRNESSPVSKSDIQQLFSDILENHSNLSDVPLDTEGKTALHFAATLAAPNLVSSFISLGLNSPIRGSNTGETPLISAILVTNSMAKGNFPELLDNWLYPDLFLIDGNNRSFLHFLADTSIKKLESCKYYFSKILSFLLSHNGNNQYYIKKLVNEIVNLQETKTGNTPLHLAIEHDNRWLIEYLIELQADLQLPNSAGVKPVDFDIVKEVMNYKNLGIKYELFEDDDYYLMQLIQTNLEFLNTKDEVTNEVLENEDLVSVNQKLEKISNKSDDSLTSTNKLFNSINDLLKNTNNEYETIMNNKKQQINELNKQLYDTTLITGNNKFLNRKINDKLIYLDNLKLQMINITEKLELLKQEMPQDDNENNENDINEGEEAFDADHPFRIESIYNKLINNESVDELKNDSNLVDSIPDSIILKARINSYRQLNDTIENELNNLKNYDDLTSKFKKVVSFCTGVDINEVDELLDGLLEAVESQT